MNPPPGQDPKNRGSRTGSAAIQTINFIILEGEIRENGAAEVNGRAVKGNGERRHQEAMKQTGDSLEKREG